MEKETKKTKEKGKTGEKRKKSKKESKNERKGRERERERKKERSRILQQGFVQHIIADARTVNSNQTKRPKPFSEGGGGGGGRSNNHRDSPLKALPFCLNLL